MLKRAMLALFACACLGLHAQTFSSLSIGQWVGERFVWGRSDYDGYALFDFAEGHITKQHVPFAPQPKSVDGFPEDLNRFVFDGTNLVLPTRVNFGVDQSKIFFYNEEPHSIVRGGDPRTMQLAVFLNHVWVPLAEMQTSSNGAILPLASSRFLVGLSGGHIVNEETQEIDPSPFAIYRLSAGGKLRFDAPIDLKPALEGINIDHVDSPLFRGINSFVITKDHYTYVCPDIGMLFVFSKRNGSLLRSVMVYPELTEHIKAGKRAVPPIICVQPTADGDILISAWSAKTSIESIDALDLFGRLMNRRYLEANGISEEEGRRRAEELQNSIIAIDPRVRWYRYTPGATALKSEPYAPYGGKDILNSEKEYREFHTWVLNNDQEIIYISNDITLRLPSDAPLLLKEAGKQFLLAN